MTHQLKRCRMCRTERELNEYHKDKDRRDGLSDVCRDCKRERWRRYSRGNKNSNYNLRRGELQALKEACGNRCQGCNKEGDLFIDHDHSDGSTRGLLCRGCNSALGMVYDSASTLCCLATYIDNHNANKKNRKESDDDKEEPRQSPTVRDL